MNKCTVLIAALFVLSCNHSSPHYYTYAHWQIPGDENRIPLKGMPKEIKESLFSDMSDSTIKGTEKFKSYDIWRFDPEGQIIYRKSCLSDSSSYETTRWYDEKGLQSETRYSNAPGTSAPSSGPRTVATSVLPDGRFKEVISGGATKDASIRLLSFSDSGNVQTIAFVPGTNIGHTVGKLVNQYKDGLIQRTVQTGNGSWLQYVYAKNNFLDSVLQFQKGKFFSKVIYTNNDNGDPLSSFTVLAKGDTVNSATMQYNYDSRGNWVKKLETIMLNSGYSNLPGKKEIKYALLVREIKY
ncbi:MAG TPA: hypothetical protein VGM41_19790 [Chitinophagaceae bacterium]